MNILYLGPYRQTDYIGQVSSLHIDSIARKLKKEDRLITRAVYLDYSLSDGTYTTKKYEKIDNINKIDTIVQYLPIDCMAINTDTFNVAIPILDAKIHNITNNPVYKTLNFYDKILVDDDKQKNIIRAVCSDKKIGIYDEKITDSKMQLLNLSPENDQVYKFGFIGQYNKNKQIIQKILTSFLLSVKNNDNIRLFLFLRALDNEKNELVSFIKDLQNQLGIPEYIDRIQNIFSMWNLEESIIALNSIDCLISINDDYKQTLYEKYFINRGNNNYLINRNNLISVETPVTNTPFSQSYSDTVSSVSTQDLIQKISSASVNNIQKNKKTEHQTLGEHICKILA